MNKQQLYKYLFIASSVSLVVYLVSNAYLVGTTVISVNPFHSQQLKYRKPTQPVPLTGELTDTFVRVTKDLNSAPIAFEVASTSYQPSNHSNLTVDLIGAVHFADKAYYEKLNQAFQTYDAVLYELIAPEGTKPDPTAEISKLGQIQFFLADLMSFDPQLIAVNYQARNFVHADTSPEQLKQIATKRGDNALSIITGVIKDFVALSAKSSSTDSSSESNSKDAFKILLDPLLLRQTFAKGLADKNTISMFDQMKTIKPYLLDERNDQALKILDDQISKGHKKIAIFYGAAHLNDLEKKLITDYGLKRTSLVWDKAWDLQTVPRKAKSEFLSVVQMLAKFL